MEINCDYYSMELKNSGEIQKLQFKHPKSKNIPFREDQYNGPQLYIEPKPKLREYIKLFHKKEHSSQSNIYFEGNDHGIQFKMQYILPSRENNNFNSNFIEIRYQIQNQTHIPIQPAALGIQLGLDCYMDKFPIWNDKFFPTLLRCEKTHFWGYTMTPNGGILGLISPNPIASWNLNYKRIPPFGKYSFGMHRIYTINLDLIHCPPLPERHPTHLFQLLPNQIYEWTFFLVPIDTFEKINSTLAEVGRISDVNRIPFLDIDATTVYGDESTNITIDSLDSCQLVLISPNQQIQVLKEWMAKKGEYIHAKFKLDLSDKPEGLYRLHLISSKGKITEGMITKRKSWGWYLHQARINALSHPPLASTHCESFYGFYTLLMSQQFLPDRDLHQRTLTRWEQIIPQMFDMKKIIALIMPNRIQNSATFIGLLNQKYLSDHQWSDLHAAIQFALKFIGCQGEDGAYYAGYGARPGKKGIHYTSVVYPAKNLMELLQTIRKALSHASKDQLVILKNANENIFTSVKHAMDDLIFRKDNIETEGEMTFEDGMISCSATQLGMFALLCEEQDERIKYQKVALELLTKHRCLTQLKIPDSRQRNATLRFWESQYDINLHPNMMNSPHGWTSWRTYATYYMYLLTGDIDWIKQTMNALGTCMQVIDAKSGELRWAFVPDPYISGYQISKSSPKMQPIQLNKIKSVHLHPYFNKGMEYVLGEQYLPMVSDWQFGNPNDNDVHEHFKCLCEVAIESAFLAYDKENQYYRCWNAKITQTEGLDRISIKIEDDLVKNVHYNVPSSIIIEIINAEHKQSRICQGMGWISLN